MLNFVVSKYLLFFSKFFMYYKTFFSDYKFRSAILSFHLLLMTFFRIPPRYLIKKMSGFSHVLPNPPRQFCHDHSNKAVTWRWPLQAPEQFKSTKDLQVKSFPAYNGPSQNKLFHIRTWLILPFVDGPFQYIMEPPNTFWIVWVYNGPSH